MLKSPFKYSCDVSLGKEAKNEDLVYIRASQVPTVGTNYEIFLFGRLTYQMEINRTGRQDQK